MPKRSVKDRNLVGRRTPNRSVKKMDSYEVERDDQGEKCKRNGKRPASGRAERESVAVAMVENKKAFALCTRERSVF
jgi:hypothetical protein